MGFDIVFCDLFGTTRFIIFCSGWHIFKLLAADAVSVVCEQSAVLWCVVVFSDPLGIRRRLFFFFASERFGRSLKNRTHKNEINSRRESCALYVGNRFSNSPFHA